MSIAERRADGTWDGALAYGQARLTVGRRAVGTLPSTWTSRTERANGQTSLEALIAAAQAGCYAITKTACGRKTLYHTPETRAGAARGATRDHSDG